MQTINAAEAFRGPPQGSKRLHELLSGSTWWVFRCARWAFLAESQCGERIKQISNGLQLEHWLQETAAHEGVESNETSSPGCILRRLRARAAMKSGTSPMMARKRFTALWKKPQPRAS